MNPPETAPTTGEKEAIRGFIARSAELGGLDDDENLFESGVVNSLFAMQLLTFIEREFGIEVGTDDLDLENFKSINAAAAFVRRKKSGGPCRTS